MHPTKGILFVTLLGACFVACVDAQTIKSANGSAVSFHEPARLESAPEAPANLRQIAAELSGSVIGQSPNLSIEFVLTLKNDGAQEVKILDPLDFFSLQFTTMRNKLIRVPRRVPKFLPQVALPRGAPRGTKREGPYPAPVQFRQIVMGGGVSSQKEETITIPAAGKVQIVFRSESVVMERVMQALRSETGEAAQLFKARALMSLVSPTPDPGVGGRSLDSDWIFFTIPLSE
jgi:hypothetical protein